MRTARLRGSTITALRRQWSPAVSSGLLKCRRCDLPITAGQDWDLGHEHDLVLGGDPGGPMRPEHARLVDCPLGGNRSNGARLRSRPRSRRRLDEWLR